MRFRQGNAYTRTPHLAYEQIRILVIVIFRFTLRLQPGLGAAA
jgi:hypothetical protein